MSLPRHAVVSAAACLLALAGTPAATAVGANPARGANFAGPLRGGGSFSFGVSTDGRRVFELHVAGLPVRCQDGPMRVGFDGGDGSVLRISRKGTFRGMVEGSSGEMMDVKGSFPSRRQARGEIDYASREVCQGGAAFTARALPGTPGLRAPVFAIAFGGTRVPTTGVPATAARGGKVTGFDQLADGSFVVAEIRSRRGRGPGGFIRRVGSDGRLTTLLAPGRDLDRPSDVAALPGGGYLIADSRANCIRRVDAAGAVTPVAGRCGAPPAFSGDGGPATAARLARPGSVDPLPDGGFVIADQSAPDRTPNRVRRVTAGGAISTIAGNGVRDVSAGDGGPATSAALGGVTDLAGQADGGVLITDDLEDRVRRVAPDGTIATVAGSGAYNRGFGGDGGPASSAVLNSPAGVAVLPGGGFLIADSGNARVRRVSPKGTIRTVAGGGEGGEGSPAGRAELGSPFKVVATSDGGVAFYDVAGYLRGDSALHLIPGRSNRRLLVGFPARFGTLSGRVARRRPFSVAVTGRSRLTVEVRRNGRVIARVRRTVGRGRTAVRLPRAVRRRGRSATYRLTATVTSGRRVATVGSRLF